MADSQNFLLKPEELNRLRTNYSYIKECLDVATSDDLMDILFGNELVSYSRLEEFRELPTRVKKVEFILNLLLKGDSYTYQYFVDFLKDNHEELYSILYIADYDATEQVDTGIQETGQEELSATGSLQDGYESEPECLKNLRDQPPKMTIDIRPVISDAVRAKSLKHRSVYRMSQPVRGVALLFFNIEFNDNVLPSRHGADYDLENLCTLFHKLKFNVIAYRNASRKEVLDEFNRQRHDSVHLNYGCFVLGFSTHGSEKAFFCADGKKVHLSEIYDYFDSVHCPYLAGKPKFMFFDANSGHARDRGVPIGKKLDPPKKIEFVNQMSSTRVSLSNMRIGEIPPVKVPPNVPLPILDISSKSKSTTIPEKTDFVVALSTYDGYVSWRRDTHGCWFSRVLVEVFQKYACEEHIVQLLKRVRRKLSYVENCHGYKQVNLTIDTLLKHFYLFPGIDL